MVSLEEIKKAVADIARENGAQFALLFGSYARGTATRRSDVDVIFVEETERPFLGRLDKYIGPLVDRLHIPAEVLVYTPSEFERMKDRPFIRQALKEGVVLYEHGEVQTRGKQMAVPGTG